MWTRTVSILTLIFALGWSAPAAAASEAEIRMRVGDVAGALPLAQQQAQGAPDDLDAQELYIDLGLSLGLRHHVEALYRKRAAEHPDSADAWYLLGRAVPSPEEAISSYERALELQPEHPRAPMGIAAVKRALGELEEAEQRYRTSLERDPTLIEAWTGLQATLLQAGRIGEAQSEARRFLQAAPSAPEPYIAIATLERDRARDVLSVGVERVPDDPRLRAMYVRTLLDAGQSGQALSQLDATLKLSPSYAEAQFLRMVARDMQSGVLDTAGWQGIQQAQSQTDGGAARAAWAGLTERYPRSALTWLGLGKVLGALGDAKGAVAPLQKAARIAPEEVEVQATYGLLLLQVGRPVDAATWLGRATAGRPRDASLAVAHVQAVAATDNPTQARALAVRAYQTHPHDLRAALGTARILSEQGDREAAYIALRDALPRIPDPRLVVALAAAARDAGHVAEAADILQRLGRTLDNETALELAEQLRKEAASQQAGEGG